MVTTDLQKFDHFSQKNTSFVLINSLCWLGASLGNIVCFIEECGLHAER